MADGWTLNPVTAAEGGVFVSTWSRVGMQIVQARDLATGALRWSHDFGDIASVNPPAYGQARVYVATGGHEDSFLWAFDAASGALAFSSPYASQWQRNFAPVVLEGAVYMAGGSGSGVYAFDATSGMERWFLPAGLLEHWTPAARDGLVYAYTGDYDPKLRVVNAATGEPELEIPDPDLELEFVFMETAPVLGPLNDVLVTQGGRLLSFDLGARAIRWAEKDAFRGAPTLADGVLYVVNADEVQARAETDGSLLWTWAPPPTQWGRLVPAVVATDNLLFVSTDSRT